MEVLYKVVLKLNAQLRYYFNKIKYFVKVSLPEIVKRVYIDYTKKGDIDYTIGIKNFFYWLEKTLPCLQWGY